MASTRPDLLWVSWEFFELLFISTDTNFTPRFAAYCRCWYDDPLYGKPGDTLTVPCSSLCHCIRISRCVSSLSRARWRTDCWNFWRFIIPGCFTGLLGLYEYVFVEYWRVYSRPGEHLFCRLEKTSFRSPIRRTIPSIGQQMKLSVNLVLSRLETALTGLNQEFRQLSMFGGPTTRCQFT